MAIPLIHEHNVCTTKSNTPIDKSFGILTLRHIKMFTHFHLLFCVFFVCNFLFLLIIRFHVLWLLKLFHQRLISIFHYTNTMNLDWNFLILLVSLLCCTLILSWFSSKETQLNWYLELKSTQVERKRIFFLVVKWKWTYTRFLFKSNEQLQ